MEQIGWETIEYRDGKYHGSILHADSRSIKHGPGILFLDQNFTIISLWWYGEPNNTKTLIITPTMEILDISQNRNITKQYQSHRNQQQSKWTDNINMLQIFSNLGEQYVLCGQKINLNAQSHNNQKWKWVLNNPSLKNTDNDLAMLYFETEQHEQTQNMDEEIIIKSIQEVNIQDHNRQKQNENITLSLNKYQTFLTKIKSILLQDDTQQKNGYKFVVSQTKTIIKSPTGIPYEKIITKIHTTHSSTVLITLSAIIQLNNEKLAVRNWGEYFISSVEFHHPEKLLDCAYRVRKQEKNKNIHVHQILSNKKQKSYVINNKNKNNRQLWQNCCKDKSHLHLISINFVNQYHINLKQSIFQIVDKMYKTYNQLKKKQKNTIGEEQEYIATNQQIKQQIQKIQRKHSLSAQRNKSIERYIKDMMKTRKKKSQQSVALSNKTFFHIPSKDKSKNGSIVCNGSLTFRSPIKNAPNQTKTKHKNNSYYYPLMSSTEDYLRKQSQGNHQYEKRQYQRIEKKRIDGMQVRILQNLRELQEIEKQKTVLKKGRNNNHQRKIGRIKKNSHYSPNRQQKSNQIQTLTTYYQQLNSTIKGQQRRKIQLKR